MLPKVNRYMKVSRSLVERLAWIVFGRYDRVL